MIYGSGLRKDRRWEALPDCDHLPAYWQVNLGLSHEFADAGWNAQPVTVRFDVVNVADTVYQIRDGSGIGVFAAQYGPRRDTIWHIAEARGSGSRS